MTISDQNIVDRFPVGYYPLHPNGSLNFQMNRFWNWVGDQDMLDELRDAGKRIANYDDWARVMLDLSETAMAAGRTLPGARFRAHTTPRWRSSSWSRTMPGWSPRFGASATTSLPVTA